MTTWHFQFNIEVDAANSLAHAKIYGIWRDDTARTYAEEFKKEVEPLLAKPWARLIDLHNWKTASDEVIDIIGELLHWCAENNCTHSVYVIDNPITYGQLMRMIEKGKTKHISKTFRTREEAEKYLKAEGYNLRPQTDERGIFK